MVHLKRRGGPLDYRLCNQTVTLYHWDGKNMITRRVIEKGAFLDFKRVQDVSKLGAGGTTGFLLVIPCSAGPVAEGDKVFHGVGPEIASPEEWRSFIPARVPGLVVVRYVDPKYWKGRMVHIEAGG